jgi:hypothetical protein
MKLFPGGWGVEGEANNKGTKGRRKERKSKEGKRRKSRGQKSKKYFQTFRKYPVQLYYKLPYQRAGPQGCQFPVMRLAD